MFGFKENAVFNDLRVGFVVIFAGAVVFKVYVCHICFKFLVFNGEGIGIEYVDFAFHEFVADFNDFFNGAFCRSAAAYVRENDRAGFNGAGPVFIDVCFRCVVALGFCHFSNDVL